MKASEKTKEKAAIDVCPLCGSKMEKGFIGVWTGIYWSDKNRKVFWKSSWDDDVIFRPGWRLKNLEACRCKSCKLVIFRYPIDYIDRYPRDDQS